MELAYVEVKHVREAEEGGGAGDTKEWRVWTGPGGIRWRRS